MDACSRTKGQRTANNRRGGIDRDGFLYTLTRGAAPQLNPQELVRVHGVVQIDDALAKCVSDPREVARWFRTLKIIAPFSGRTPLALLLRGMTGIKSVAEYLAAWEATARESDRN